MLLVYGEGRFEMSGITAKERLKEIRLLNHEILAMNEQVDKLMKDAQGVKAVTISDMPRGGVPRDMADAVADAVDLQSICMEHVRRIIGKKKEALNTIARMHNTEERAVLILRYFDEMEWQAIADIMEYSVRHVMRIHGEALQSYEKAMRE